ncbi:Pkinase-domain-containing protein [Gonapodya prolifera JEL478]|uniref:Serine/threonine-protein kinase n=1 Tax=Gonapodya prolifera (strain JEL478) TaxID=1344416 RepID=A0A139AEF5_GONPJ|nr:Pkinase-domain-containing protein [Gonapodya prolifera JEL478]|eukprot:KXS15147.1 Pkinase-domain-containing protein [Gonapodya prolifera JEL478]
MAGAIAQMESEKVPPKPPRQAFSIPPAIIRNRKTGAAYITGGLLGEGGFARCYEVADSGRRRFAAKVVAKASLKTQKQRQKLHGEIAIHRALSHRNIVRFYEAFEDDENIYMIVELCENKTFVDLLKQRRRLTEPETRLYMVQLLTAVRYMHLNRVIHRDLKLGNLFLSKDMQLKIGDFGLAAVIKHDGERKKTICGTPNYIAPEVLFDQQNGHSYEVDIWSLGVIMYTFLIGRPPFQTKDKDVKAIYKKIRDNVYEFPSNAPISLAAENLISNLLHTRPECRPNIDDILNDPFFTTPPVLKSIPVSCLNNSPETSFANSELRNAHQPTTLQTAATGRAPLSLMNGPNKETPRRPISEKEKLEKEPKATEERSYSPRSQQLLPPSSSTLTRTSRAVNPASTVPSHTSTRTPPVLGQVASTTPTRVLGRTRSDTAAAHQNTTPRSPAQMIKTPLPRPASPDPVPPPPPVPSYRSRQSDELKPSQSTLDVICENLTTAIEHYTEGVIDINEECAVPKVFVSKWIDVSHKYGLGYQLTNGCVGVYFNDDSSLLVSPNNTHLEYLYYSKTSGRPEMNRWRGRMDDSPDALQKKVTLLQQFREYMKEHLSKHTPSYCYTEKQSFNMEFLTNHVRSKHAVLFRLSNRIVQVSFFDHTKVILSEEGRVMTFIGRDRQPICRRVEWFMHSGNADAIDRLAYARDVLEGLRKPQLDVEQHV